MATRYEVERAVMASRLPPLSRELILVLATRINAKAGVILPRHQPSLNVLHRSTGMSRRSVMRHLSRLERDGWIQRTRPDPVAARTQYMTTQYELFLPRDSTSPDLGPRSHGPRATAAPPRATAARALGTGGPPEQRRETDRDDSESTAAAAGRDDELTRIVSDELGQLGRILTPEQCTEVVRLVLAGRKIRAGSEGAYLRRAIRENPDRYAPPKRTGPRRFRGGKFIE